MKQSEVVKHKPYRLAWMQCRNRLELNGVIVEAVRKKQGSPKKPFVDYNGMPHGAGRSPARFLLNIGVSVGAANLQEIEVVRAGRRPRLLDVIAVIDYTLAASRKYEDRHLREYYERDMVAIRSMLVKLIGGESNGN